MRCHCTRSPVPRWGHMGSLPVQVDGSGRRVRQPTARAITRIGGGHPFPKANNMTNEIESTRKLAEHVGLKLIEQRDARNGQYRLQHGRDIVAHSDSLKDLQGFALGWRAVA